MKTLIKYSTIYSIYFRTSLSRDLSFRLNFFMSIIGSFCFVALNFFTIYFLIQKVEIGSWTNNEMLILLGNFYISSYAIFFFFWRGFTSLIRNIRNGGFDFYLIKPIDSQFLVSILGGGLHNLLAIIFGVWLVFYGISLSGAHQSLYSISMWLVVSVISILDCYSFCFLLLTLNFRFGYLEEILSIALSYQSFARYPIDAFTRLPVYLLVFAIPFSLITTIPTLVLIKPPQTYIPLLITFLITSFVFILSVRKIWKSSIKNYTSSN